MAPTDYTVKNLAIPDMTSAAFVAALKAAKSPVPGAEAEAVYAYCAARKFSPAALLAWFTHESGMGRNGWAAKTKSWGNTRPPSFARPGIGSYNQDTGKFYPYGSVPPTGRYLTAYATWSDGGVATVARFLDHAPYSGKDTVAAIVPTWAPSDDGNDVAAYVRSVLAGIARFAAPAPPGPTKETIMGKYADVEKLISVGDNRPGTKLRGFHACVAHETDNEAAGANALMHYGYITGAPRADKPSFHLCADADQSLQFLPVAPGVAEVGWHIGDGADQADDEAFFTIGGEICVNSRAGFPAACKRMAKSFAAVLNAYGEPCVDGVTVRQHGSYWSARNPAVHKGCPRHLRAGDWGVTWPQFVAMVQAELDALTPPPVPPAPPVVALPSVFIRMARALVGAA